MTTVAIGSVTWPPFFAEVRPDGEGAPITVIRATPAEPPG